MAHDLNYVLTIPIGQEHRDLLAQLAVKDGRTFTGFCRYVLYARLQSEGLLDDEFEVNKEVAQK